jgi:hypothetical protein
MELIPCRDDGGRPRSHWVYPVVAEKRLWRIGKREKAAATKCGGRKRAGGERGCRRKGGQELHVNGPPAAAPILVSVVHTLFFRGMLSIIDKQSDPGPVPQ